jgi:hypothetical protein
MMAPFKLLWLFFLMGPHPRCVLSHTIDCKCLSDDASHRWILVLPMDREAVQGLPHLIKGNVMEQSLRAANWRDIRKITPLTRAVDLCLANQEIHLAIKTLKHLV